MKHSEFSEKLHQELESVHVSPALRRQTLEIAQGKGGRIVKRKLSFALAAALIVVTLCASALAAVGRWGMLDFVGRYRDSYVPEDAQSYVQTDVLAMENEWVTVRIRELYYDGRISRMIADVTPKAENVLILGEDACMEDLFINLTHEYVMDGENDMRSICQVIEDEGYTDVYVANVSIVGQGDMYAGAMDYILGEDGTLTIYSQEEYASDMPEREVTIHAIVMPYEKPFTLESLVSYEKRKELEETVTLKASVNPTSAPVREGEIANVYVNTEPIEYESIGVRVDKVIMEVKPQEIYATLEYTVIDREKYAATDDGLWFEYIDPSSTETAYYDQRLKDGLTGGGSSGPVNGDLETATVFRQMETLAKYELHDTYTIRAFECWEKQRFETHTFTMRPATAQDMADK